MRARVRFVPIVGQYTTVSRENADPGWTHPNKELLHAWYTRIGYRPVGSVTSDESYPWLAPLLATPCDFVIYHKDLTQT